MRPTGSQGRTLYHIILILCINSFLGLLLIGINYTPPGAPRRLQALPGKTKKTYRLIYQSSHIYMRLGIVAECAARVRSICSINHWKSIVINL